jgi:hypothetical protein
MALNRLARLARRVGRRGAWLLFLALVDLVYGFGLPELLRRPPARLAFLAEILPSGVWVGMWVAVGLTCLVQAFAIRDRIAFAAATMLKVLWGTVYLVGWMLLNLPRGQVGAVVWLALAGVTVLIAGWRENWER